jgi:hypothetical protein
MHRSLLQLSFLIFWHSSTAFTASPSQCFTIACIIYEKNSCGCMHSHSCSASYVSSSDWKTFPPRASLDGPKVGSHKGVRSGKCGGWARRWMWMPLIVWAVAQTICGLMSCCYKTPAVGSQWSFHLISGLRRLPWKWKCEALVTGPFGHVRALQVCLGAPKTVSASLFLQMSACGMFWVLVSWHVAVLCLPTSFQAGSSGHRYHLQSQCVPANCHLLFCIIKIVAAVLDVKSWFSSPHHIQDAIFLTERMHVGCLDNWLLNWKEEMCAHASSVACHYKSVGMAY